MPSVDYNEVVKIRSMYRGSEAWIMTKKESGKIPVSYTHLDVYKRQTRVSNSFVSFVILLFMYVNVAHFLLLLLFMCCSF